MKYRINGHILFDADTGSLSLKDFSDDPLPISNPSKRLLLLLITHHGEPVGREVIFRKVWDDYGMISSNNNLNQCVSKLRRMLKTLGIDEEVIITVPKVGFMLSRDIAIEACDEEQFMPMANDSYLATRTLIHDLESAEDPVIIPTVRAEHGALRCWAIISAAMAVTVTLMIGLTVFFTSTGVRQERYIGDSGSCKVFLSSTGRVEVHDPGLDRDVLAFSTGQHAQCSGDEYLLVVKSNQVRSYISGISRLFILRCKIAREHRIEICYGLQNEQLP